MTFENVLTHTGSVSRKLMIVVQIHMILPRKIQLLISLSELKQLLLMHTLTPFHIGKQLKVVERSLTLPITMIDKVMMRTQWLGIMLLLRLTVRNFFPLFCNFQVQYLIELSNILNLLPFWPNFTKRLSSVFKVRCKLPHWIKMSLMWGLRALNPNISVSFQQLLPINTHYIKKQNNEMYINFINWNFIFRNFKSAQTKNKRNYFLTDVFFNALMQTIIANGKPTSLPRLV